jgi:DNA-binding SARP family transcriptional activator
LVASRKTRGLIAYLVLTRCPHRREHLCEMFWDVPDDPRGALRWSLSKIRPLVDEPLSPRLLADRQTVELRTEGLDLDFFTAQVCAGDRLRRQVIWRARRCSAGRCWPIDLPESSVFHS